MVIFDMRGRCWLSWSALVDVDEELVDCGVPETEPWAIRWLEWCSVVRGCVTSKNTAVYRSFVVR